IGTGAEQFGHAEIEKLGNSVTRDKNVTGLEVAMDNKRAVCIRDGLAYALKQTKPRFQAQMVLATVGVDGLPLHLLHEEERTSVGCGATINETRYIRVLEVRKNLALVTKAAQPLGRIHASPDDFDRYPLTIML